MAITSSNAFLVAYGAAQTANAQYILNYLCSRGWTKNAVCAMLGNMQTESSINPGIWEGLNYGNYNGGYGLVQWTPAYKYTDWAVARGYGIGDINGQLERIIWEKDNGVQWYATSAYNMSFSEFAKSTGNVYDLALAFLANYERPYNPNQPARGTQAQHWYNSLSTSGGSDAIEKAVTWAVGIANDNSHGYDQGSRWGPDYDCSSLLIQAWENAGIPVKTNGATYTGNMYNVFVDCGFVDVTANVNLANGAGVERGDILLNIVNHVAMSTGNGTLVQASQNEFGGITGGQIGDQSGNEIYLRSYYNYPWDVVLRYPGGSIAEPTLVSLVSWIPA